MSYWMLSTAKSVIHSQDNGCCMFKGNKSNQKNQLRQEKVKQGVILLEYKREARKERIF